MVFSLFDFLCLLSDILGTVRLAYSWLSGKGKHESAGPDTLSANQHVALGRSGDV